MRYFVLTYYKQPDSTIQEHAEVLTTLKPRDWPTRNVILDFKDEKILKCAIDGTNVDTEWARIIAYFSRHYGDTFAKMTKAMAALD